MNCSNASSNQVPWVDDNVIGHSIDPETGRIDSTEGFGAYDSVLKTNAVGPRVVDIGGGEYDVNSAYAAYYYLLDCSVYDPYKRNVNHCAKIVAESKIRPFDTAFSFSVLNVISTLVARLDHIRLCRDVLKTGGKAFFKVWPGNKSRSGETTSSYQSNCSIDDYKREIEGVWGVQNVFFRAKEQTICCINSIDTYSSGTRFI